VALRQYEYNGIMGISVVCLMSSLRHSFVYFRPQRCCMGFMQCFHMLHISHMGTLPFSICFTLSIWALFFHFRPKVLYGLHAMLPYASHGALTWCFRCSACNVTGFERPWSSHILAQHSHGGVALACFHTSI